MSQIFSIQSQARNPSVQMRAVLLILEADPYLKSAVLPFVDLDRESIQWEQWLA